MEDHLFVSLEPFLQLVCLLQFQRSLACAIEILLHLGVVELLTDHVEVPIGLWKHAWEKEDGLNVK